MMVHVDGTHGHAPQRPTVSVLADRLDADRQARDARERADREAIDAKVQAIDAEIKAEKQQKEAELEEARSRNSVSWGWGSSLPSQLPYVHF